MSDEFSKEFFPTYHATVFEALGDDAQGYAAKIGAMLAHKWLEKLNALPKDGEEFKKAVEEYMSGPFRFADIARMTFGEDGTASLYVKGCDICKGNDILRSMGKKGCCPISHMVKSSMGRTIKDRVELTGIEKPGPVGECYLRYKL